MQPTPICDDIQQLASSSMDEPLSDADRRRLDAHLATCEYCTQAVRQMRGVDRTLRHTPLLMVPQEFTQKVLTAAFADGSVARSLSFGVFILLLGVLFMSGLWLITNVALFARLIDLFLDPEQVRELREWGPRTLDAVGEVLTAGWLLIGSLRDLLFGPLLIPLLIALLVSAGGLLLFRRLSRRRAVGTSRG